MSGVLTNSFSGLLKLHNLSVGVVSLHPAAVGLELGIHKQQGMIPTLGLRKKMKFPPGPQASTAHRCCWVLTVTLAPSANKTDPVMQPLC